LDSTLNQYPARQLIPFEISEKIVSKIKANEPFHAYIVIPMHPEGLPDSAAVQEILHWQFQTVHMMYRRIATAIQEAGSSAAPTDYLSFFFLGQRESP
jgi:phospholipase D1/2